jgi:hypothetical protein
MGQPRPSYPLDDHAVWKAFHLSGTFCCHGFTIIRLRNDITATFVSTGRINHLYFIPLGNFAFSSPCLYRVLWPSSCNLFRSAFQVLCFLLCLLLPHANRMTWGMWFATARPRGFSHLTVNLFTNHSFYASIGFLRQGFNHRLSRSCCDAWILDAIVKILFTLSSLIPHQDSSFRIVGVVDASLFGFHLSWSIQGGSMAFRKTVANYPMDHATHLSF